MEPWLMHRFLTRDNEAYVGLQGESQVLYKNLKVSRHGSLSES